MSSGSESLMEFPPRKRRRWDDDDDDEEETSSCRRCAKRKHMYLVTDYQKGSCSGYAIHKLDADDPPERLPEPALRIAAVDFWPPMSFAAAGAAIFVATNPRGRPPPPVPTLVYDTAAGALGLGPRLPDGYDRGRPMAVGDRLYEFTVSGGDDVEHEDGSSHRTFLPGLQVLSWKKAAPRPGDWDVVTEWSWGTLPPPPESFGLRPVDSYAVHPDGRTVFMSSDHTTVSFDTGSGEWREHGSWVLPFKGQAYYDDDLDAWVGLHHKQDGYICCCPVASRRAPAAAAPKCTVLKEKLFASREEKLLRFQFLEATLTYVGNGRFCLAENVLLEDRPLPARGVLRLTLFGLRYDHRGELRIKAHRTTRSYPLSKMTTEFSQQVFWM